MKSPFSLACLIALGWAQNFGIGTIAPDGRLHVVGSAGVGRSVIIDNREIKFRGDGVEHFSIFGATTGRARFSISRTSSASTPGVEDAELVSILGSGNVGIGVTDPTERLHVQGNLRLQGAFMPNNNPGTSGQILISQGAGNPPQWSSAATLVTSVSLNARWEGTSTTFTNVPGMSLTFTARSDRAFVIFTASGYGFTNSMSYVEFRIVNTTTNTPIGGTNTHIQSYDDATGTVTPWSCSFSRLITGLIPGTNYTLQVQAQRNGILGTYNPVIDPINRPGQHMTLSVLH